MIPAPHPYPAYKPSGIPWLGDVPHHWEVRRFGTLAQGFNNGITANQLEIGESNHLVSRIETISNGAIDYTRVGYLAEGSDHQVYLLEEHDFLISHINSYARVGNSARYRGERPLIHGMNLIRITPFNAVIPSYLEYLLKSDVFIGAMRRACKPAINQVSVTTTAIKAIRLPLPPVPEQVAIVRYLDHADRRIRRYVDAKRKLIALLKEEKQAIVNQAVTRGLDPNVPLKPSGVEWLGDVPEHWEVRRLSQVSRIVRGKFTHRPRNDPSLYDGPYPFIQTGDIAGASKMIIRYTQTLNERGFAVSTMFPRGTLVMTIAANIGDVAILGFDACFPDSVVGFGPSKNLHRDHLYYLFTAMKREFLREAPVNTQGNLNVDRIGSRKIPFPPFSEQASIVGHIDKATADIDAAVVRTRRQIELLQEYRTRLIADVVTGKLDVREPAAQLSEEDEGLELHETAGLAGEVERL